MAPNDSTAQVLKFLISRQLMVVYSWISLEDLKALQTSFTCQIVVEMDKSWKKPIQRGQRLLKNIYARIIDQAWGQDGWILAKFFFFAFL